METDTMDLRHDFAAGLARTALADTEAEFARALKRDITKRQRAALVNLREKSVVALRYIEAGRNDRLPASVLDETLQGIRDILHGSQKEAIAKAASGPGNRAAGLERDGLIPDPLTGAKLEGEALVQACVALAKEFKELAERARKVMKKFGAEQDFDEWERKYHKRIAEALLKTGSMARSDRDVRSTPNPLGPTRRSAGYARAASGRAREADDSAPPARTLKRRRDQMLSLTPTTIPNPDDAIAAQVAAFEADLRRRNDPAVLAENAAAREWRYSAAASAPTRVCLRYASVTGGI